MISNILDDKIVTAPSLTLETGLPANVDAERTILGAILLDNDAWAQVRQGLEPNDFCLDSHRRIALRMSQIAKNDRTIDIITLAELLGSTHEIEAIGGVAYLASLTEGMPRRPVIEEYIRIVKEKSLLRQLIFLANNTVERAIDGLEPVLEIVADLSGRMENLAAPVSNPDSAKVESFIVDTLAEINAEYKGRLSPAIPSGNQWFDTKTGGGYRRGKISLACARPGVGKTAWMNGSVAHNCKAGRKCVVFSLEMEKGELIRSLIPWVTDVPNVVSNRPWTQTAEQNQQVNQGISAICEWPLSIYDGDMDIDQICWTIDRETRRGEEVLFGLDHFGLIAGGSTKARDTRERYNENSARLRRKIKHKQAALLILCQLRKVSREFADKPPVPDDVKESGNMWEDCFAGLLIHRGYEKENIKMSKEAHLNLAKLRSGGSPGSVTGSFNTRRLEFVAEAELEDMVGEDWHER